MLYSHPHRSTLELGGTMSAQENHTSLGQLINSKRRAQGLTQSELAEQLRVSDQAVSKWERNLSRPGLRVTNKLKTLLDISTEELTTAQQATPSHYRILQAFDAYLTFGLLVAAMVLAIVATVLLILEQIELRNAVIMIGMAVVGVSVILFDVVDDKNAF